MLRTQNTEYSVLFYCVDKYMQMILKDEKKRQEITNLITKDYIFNNKCFDDVIKPYLLELNETNIFYKSVTENFYMFSKTTKLEKLKYNEWFLRHKNFLNQLRMFIINIKQDIKQDFMAKNNIISYKKYFYDKAKKKNKN